MRHNESRLQASCVIWFRYQYPKIGKLLFAVPNGGSRSVVEAKIMKSEGVTAGVSDCILLVGRHGFNSLCIEFKIGDGKQTELQKEWAGISEANGNKYVVCRDLEGFMEIINWYLS